MATNDSSDVKVAFSASSYQRGDTMELVVTGQNKHTSDGTTTHEAVIVNATIEFADGSTAVLQSQVVNVDTPTEGGVTMEDVTIVSASDGSSRVYTAKAGSGGRIFTAVA